MEIIDARKGIQMERTITEDTSEQQAAVQQILQDVQTYGDQALFRWTEQLDGVRLQTLRVSEAEIDDAYRQVSDGIIQTIRRAADHIRDFMKNNRETHG